MTLCKNYNNSMIIIDSDLTKNNINSNSVSKKKIKI